ncbi:deoxyribodipyrimidine photolyase [Vittaforma corneae ATCC 50505]|uniref:Deoxyribodipyrimidine photo-lyase n=1 Tax=Vittaforma corneae (strain ATCC 50505) TaxID=993615 RepID=L2GL16_VITCO|nr:deoxyribodipyrimidine photolyase [Vittaforma corneae ATCC 50505]ELA41546.1 deoxyribodipyrimidine photolyase [Vittaforma corneae ATCC 50505]
MTITNIYFVISALAVGNPLTMESRVEQLNSFQEHSNVLYIMSRDQRIHENHSVALSYSLSYKNKSKLLIGIELSKLQMNEKQKTFILEGLVELNKEAKKYNLHVYNITDIEPFIISNSIGTVVLDFNPMRVYIKRQNEISKICEKHKTALFVCDSHNIVPCKTLKVYKRTSKAVRTDLYKEWRKYLKEYEKIEPHKFNKPETESGNNTDEFESLLRKNPRDKQCTFTGGYSEGMKQLELFFCERFSSYSKGRNDPETNVLSDLSPYIHAGHISALQTIFLTIERYGKDESDNYQAFINEMFIWRETAEHFVYHEKNYDNINGALAWAKNTLLYHVRDQRPAIYDRNQLESARTDDPLWNAAQRQMTVSGKMHGYVRMYWAKKILEWTEDPRNAIRIGIEMNDQYSIDGNDPNGYLGVMWSVCGSMDRAFAEKPIYGKIRSMKSFKCPLYIDTWTKK